MRLLTLIYVLYHIFEICDCEAEMMRTKKMYNFDHIRLVRIYAAECCDPVTILCVIKVFMRNILFAYLGGQIQDKMCKVLF
jgi:hypothetical protein